MLRTFLAVILAVSVVSCAGVKMSEKNINIVMAKNVEKGKGATDITDTFTFEGQIFVYITFTWDEVERQGGNHEINVKWYSGEKLVSTRTHQALFGRPPYYVWFYTSGTSLGVGKAKVEIYADGVLVGSKAFEVVAK